MYTLTVYIDIIIPASLITIDVIPNKLSHECPRPDGDESVDETSKSKQASDARAIEY